MYLSEKSITQYYDSYVCIGEYIAKMLYKQPAKIDSAIFTAVNLMNNLFNHLKLKENNYSISLDIEFSRILLTAIEDTEGRYASVSLQMIDKVSKSLRELLESCGICHGTYKLEHWIVPELLEKKFPMVFRIVDISQIVERIVKCINDENYRIEIKEESLDYINGLREPLQQQVDMYFQKKKEEADEKYINLSDDELCWIKANTIYNSYIKYIDFASELSDDERLFRDNFEKFKRNEVVNLFHNELLNIKSKNSDSLTIRTPPDNARSCWELFTKVFSDLQK